MTVRVVIQNIEEILWQKQRQREVHDIRYTVHLQMQIQKKKKNRIEILFDCKHFFCLIGLNNFTEFINCLIKKTKKRRNFEYTERQYTTKVCNKYENKF